MTGVEGARLVEVLSLKPGDALVISADHPISAAVADQIKRQIRGTLKLGDDFPVIVAHGARFAVVRQDDGEIKPGDKATLDVLDRLPLGSVILTGSGVAAQLVADRPGMRWWKRIANRGFWEAEWIASHWDATVLHVGTAPGEYLSGLQW